MAKARILVVDDEQNAREALRSLLTDEGYEVAEAADGEAALALVATFSPDVVLSDVRMPKMDGLTLLKTAKEQGSHAAFVMMTAFATVDLAVQAMRDGAEQFLTKPLDFDAVLIVLAKVLSKRQLEADATLLRERVKARYAPGNIVGSSPELQAVFEVVQRAAPTRATVLILGESGTGKELVAQALHESSPRADKRFVKVNCAALTESLLESELFGHEKGSFTGAIARREGRFELADGGTLFLDEVGEISPALQVKLLRVLQTREFERVGGTQTLKVDVRMVAATNRDLAAEVKNGRFREDLYYRLNVVSVTLPPLRRRKSDIPALASHFVEKYARSYGKQVVNLSPAALQQMMAYEWPGNVRELENVIERAVVLCTSRDLNLDDLPPALRGARASAEPGHAGTVAEDVLRGSGGKPLIPGATLYEIEKEAILRTLDMVGGSTSKAAEILDISVRKIQYRLKEYGLGGRQGHRPAHHDDDDEEPEPRAHA